MLKISLYYLRARISSTIFNIILLSLGIVLILALISFNNQIKEQFSKNSENIDLVIGAKGSPLQLVLSSVYHIDIPTGNIPLGTLEKLQKLPQIKNLTPISLGDNYRNFRIVGTNQNYLKIFNAKIKEGKTFVESMEAIVGSEVAKENKMKIGEVFAGSHGLVGGHAHENKLYRVVGILEKNNSVIDNLIVTSLQSVWDIHSGDDDGDEPQSPNGEKEITAILGQYRMLAAAMSFPRMINSQTNLMAASPAFEMTKLSKILGFSISGATIFGVFIILITFINIFISVLNNATRRVADVALLRALGATQKKVIAVIFFENLLTGIFAAFFGFVIAHLCLALIGIYSLPASYLAISGASFYFEEILVIFFVVLLSCVIALIPALKSYKIDVAKTLEKS